MMLANFIFCETSFISIVSSRTIIYLDLCPLGLWVDKLVSATEAFGMVVNTAKTKVMRVSWDPASRNVQLKIKGEPVENVDSFVYLGNLLTCDNDRSKSIKGRLGLAGASFKNLLPI